MVVFWQAALKILAAKALGAKKDKLKELPEAGGFQMPKQAVDFVAQHPGVRPGVQNAMDLLGGARNIGNTMTGQQGVGDLARQGMQAYGDRAGLGRETTDWMSKKAGGFIGGLFGR